MIKLFLITLLCATLVFADSPVQNFEDAWEKPVKGFLSTFMDHGSSLVRRSAQGPSPPAGRPGGRPGGSGGSGGAEGRAGGGMGFKANMGGGATAARK